MSWKLSFIKFIISDPTHWPWAKKKKKSAALPKDQSEAVCFVFNLNLTLKEDLKKQTKIKFNDDLWEHLVKCIWWKIKLQHNTDSFVCV